MAKNKNKGLISNCKAGRWYLSLKYVGTDQKKISSNSNLKIVKFTEQASSPRESLGGKTVLAGEGHSQKRLAFG